MPAECCTAYSVAVTEVWRTHGHRYHTRQDCPGLLDGQQKARREGKPTYSPELVSLSSVRHKDGPTPCLRCWPEEAGWYDWLPVELAAENHSGHPRGSPTELTFLQAVLERVPGLDPGHIKVQYTVERHAGRPYEADFAVLIPGRQPLLLEVDGQNKAPDQRPDYAEYTQKRDEELEQLGYRVRHFTNTHVLTDPQWCRNVVARLISELPTSGPNALGGGSAPATQAPSMSANRESSCSGAIALVVLVLVVVAVIAAGVFLLTRGEPGVAADANGGCDGEHPVKANETGIYHVLGGQFYDDTTAIRCFATPAEAENDGYRRSQR
jgi:very-short-patch-repair endonuclease